ncbi:MAG TPA: divergent polysaccharide deacetylase family protein [Thermoanaerobaculia bacterium]|nr:divergent polysaccharide deacetylase family protein [Thermoanaerobaculia bacterium]
MARRRSGGSGRGGVWLFLLGVLVGGGVLYLMFRDPRYGSGEAKPEVRPAKVREDSARPGVQKAAVGEHGGSPDMPSLPPEAPDAEPVEDGASHLPGHVALVIDDLGERPEDLAPLLALGVPVTYAVLPYEERTNEVVAELRKHGVEMLLHLPMQPRNGEDPGPGALTVDMDDDQLREATEAALRAVPGAVGVNNHMGSRLSEDERALAPVLQVLAGHGLFFLDSRTSAESVGYRTARSLGLPAAERQVFLDRDPSPEGVRTQFQRLLELSRTRGSAVAIGHPLPDTLQVLTDEVPKAREAGFVFVPVSDLLDRSDAGGADE